MGRFYLIAGNDEFAVKNRARTLAGELAGGEPENHPDWELLRGDAPEMTSRMLVMEAANSLCTPPFLSERKTVWLMNFAGFADLDDADKEMKFAVDRMLELLKKGLPENVDFLWSGFNLDMRKAAAKALKAIPDAQVEIYTPLSAKSKDFPQAMQSRLTELSRTWNKRLEPRAADFLINAVGGDTGRLAAELDKIFTYLGNDRDTATLDDCRRVVSATPEALGWELSGAIQSRDAGRALTVVSTLIKQLKSSRSSGLELSMLYYAVGAFTDILNARRAMLELEVPRRIGPNYFSGLDPALKEKFPDNLLLSMHPYRAYKLCETAAQFGDTELTKAFAELLDANLALVTGRGEARIVLEQLIMNVCRRH